MYLEMLIAEMRDRCALAECAEAYTEHAVPLLNKAQGLQAAYFAGEEGESTLAIVTIVWISREAAATWLSTGGQRVLLAALRPHTRGDVITKFFRVEHERGNIEQHTFN